MGKKPSSAPEVANGNVPRSGRMKKPGIARDESLWSAALEQHEQEQEMQMREAVQNASKDFLAVHVMGDSERSSSISTGGASEPEVKTSSMV